MEHCSFDALKPATSYTRVGDDGSAWLEGSKCRACGARFVGARENCARCGVRGFMESYPLSEYGRLYNYTIVYRSYPGISVPFVSAVVDLDDGTSVKGNLLEVEPTADALAFGMPVKMVFRGAETANADALGYLAHFFVPA
ncbi:putative OB-fold protein [Paraburkholderia sp. GAS448]|jgi:uncharacterized protein|uniref:Zn-ribbon domain-containing OB-fold protein n=1 Tax=Paraburkholderia sp. GAS448 TaxID=3035136 RepID=UPI003D2572D4